ncbi:unnamed protein product, partial [Urochloa humidicola]
VRCAPPVPRTTAAATNLACHARRGIHTGCIRGTGGEEDGGRGNGGVARRRPRGGGEPQMQMPSTGTGVKAASGVRLVTADSVTAKLL